MTENKWIEIGFVSIWTGCQDTDRDEWLKLRAGSVGASEIEALTKNGAGRKEQIRRKAAERLGLVDESETSFQTHAMKRGLALEEQAAEVLAGILEIKLFKIGIVRNKLWPGYHVSPDRGFFKTGMPIPVEIKCLESPAHIEALKTGAFPAKYSRQIEMQMAIMDSSMGVSFCWHPKMPPVLNIHHLDDAGKSALQSALAIVSVEIEQEMARLRETISDGWNRSSNVAACIKEELE